MYRSVEWGILYSFGCWFVRRGEGEVVYSSVAAVCLFVCSSDRYSGVKVGSFARSCGCIEVVVVSEEDLLSVVSR
jgi:hypothetical protein